MAAREPDRKPVHIGIVIPTQFELAPLQELFPQLTLQKSSPWQIYQADLEQTKLTVIVSFIGPANAAAATEHLIGYGPDLLMHGGAAGAIDSSLMPGDIVLGAACKIISSKETLEVRKTLLIATTAIRYLKDGQSVHCDQLPGDEKLLKLALTANSALEKKFQQWQAPGWPAEHTARPAKVVAGVIGSLDGWTKGLEQLNFVRDSFSVDAEDMESAYIAQVAAIHGIANLAIRGISNNEYLRTLEKSEIIPAVEAAAARVAMVMQLVIGGLAN